MTWPRPVGIGFLVVALLFGIGVRVEIGHATTSWVLTALYVVLGVICALIGIGLMAFASRLDSRRRG